MNQTPRTPLWKYPLRAIRRLAQSVGYDIVSVGASDPIPTDDDPKLLKLIEEIRPFSLATRHRMAAMADSVRYVVGAGVPGAIVECGVFRGANMMLAAKVLLEAGVRDRELFLYDTFEGMPPPTNEDVDYWGVAAESRLESHRKGTGVWCDASLDEVRRNMEATGYPGSLTRYVKGKVEETLPAESPSRIALLRLDTDWYQSTKHEMEHLYHLLEPGGVLLIDDYGHWRGSKQAVDEYFASKGISPMLHRIDHSCRSFVKPR